MTALYPLGTDSPYNNEELRYSLRSLEMCCSDIDRIVLVGEKPHFLNDQVIHLPYSERGNKEYRIAAKVLHACDTGAVTGDFLFLNDDFFFTKNFKAATFPFYQRGPLQQGPPRSLYQETLLRTRLYLEKHGKETMHFDAHCPIVYNAEKFRQLRESWCHSFTNDGLVVKSTYCNMHGITGPQYDDVKISKLATDEDFARINSTVCFSIPDSKYNSESAWSRGVHNWLKTRYPNKSRWEI